MAGRKVGKRKVAIKGPPNLQPEEAASAKETAKRITDARFGTARPRISEDAKMAGRKSPSFLKSPTFLPTEPDGTPLPMKVSEALHIGEPNKGESLIAKPPAQLGGTHVSFAPSPTPDGEGSSYDDVKQYPDLLNDLRALIPKLGLDQAGQNLLRTKLDQKRGELSARLREEFTNGEHASSVELAEARRKLADAQLQNERLDARVREAKKAKSEEVQQLKQKLADLRGGGGLMMEERKNGFLAPTQASKLPHIASSDSLMIGRDQSDAEIALRRSASQNATAYGKPPMEGTTTRVSFSLSRLMAPTAARTNAKAPDPDRAPPAVKFAKPTRLPAVGGRGGGLRGDPSSGDEGSEATSPTKSVNEDASNTINGMSLSDYIRYGDAGPPKRQEMGRTQARDKARREEEEKKARKVRGGHQGNKPFV